jgi:hypothetical protein
MLNRSSRNAAAAVPALAALILVSLVACGGPASPTGSDPLGAEPNVILSQVFDNVEQGGQRFLNVSVPSAGNLEVTVQWNDPANSVSATLIGVGCPNYRAAADCQERRSFPRSGREFREGVISNPGASGTYHLVVENAGPGVETIHVTAALLNWQPTPAWPSPTPNPYSPTPYPTPYPTDHPPH